MTTDPNFMRVSFTVEYIVPQKFVKDAARTIDEDVDNMVRFDKVRESIIVRDAPEATWADVPSWMVYDDDDQRSEDEHNYYKGIEGVTRGR
jgi:hypothetical protein